MKPQVFKQDRDEELEEIDTKSIKTAYRILFVFIVLIMAGSVIAGLVLFITALTSETYFMILIALGVIVVGVLLSFLLWALLKPVIGMMYDVKLIRYHLDSKNEIKEEIIKK